VASIKPIRDHIIFKFEDDIVKKTDMGRTRQQFSETTDWGFEISSYDEGTKQPRWGIVVAIGHKVKENIPLGARILIDALKWTEAAEFNGESIWRTDESCILAIDEDYQP